MNTTPKILITGKNGQIGWELQRTLMPLGNISAMDRQAGPNYLMGKLNLRANRVYKPLPVIF